jgi:hypothetical protein
MVQSLPAGAKLTLKEPFQALRSDLVPNSANLDREMVLKG